MKAMGGASPSATTLLDQGHEKHTAGLDETHSDMFSSDISDCLTAAHCLMWLPAVVTWPHQSNQTRLENTLHCKQL